MQISSRETTPPAVSPHGEIIYELIGRLAASFSEKHSLALVVLPPGKSSLPHYHPSAEESYFILHGQARLVVGDESVELSSGQAALITPPHPHRITNIGEEDLEFLAVCVPAWEGENSVYLDQIPG